MRLLIIFDSMGTFFHAQPLQQVRTHSLAKMRIRSSSKKMKARGAGITLAARASTQLVVNTPGLVAFRAYDVQATRRQRPRRARDPQLRQTGHKTSCQTSCLVSNSCPW